MRSVSLSYRTIVLLAGLSATWLAGQAPQAGPPLSITLADALQRARAYSPQFLASGTVVNLAREDRKQAKAALLPSVNVLNQYIYTQDNGTPEGVFVSNNGVHVYDEQASAHAELFSITKQAEYRRTIAAEALAQARLAVATRGLTFTVTDAYYALILAQRRLINARSTLEEAIRFEDLTRRQEQGGEVARADVVKAQLQRQQRERDVAEAETNIEKARIALAVLLFQDLNQPFGVVDDLSPDLGLPEADQARVQAVSNNPDIRAAEFGIREAQYGVQAARGLYFPSLSVDYFYGIDANVFAIHGPFGRQNLGSVVAASVNVPVWNWGATRSRVRQAELVERQAQVDLNLIRRQVQANLESLYLEARAARDRIDSLRASVDSSAESLRLTNLRYQGGEATALEVVDAQSTAALARDGYDAGLIRYRVAVVNLQTLTGTLAP